VREERVEGREPVKRFDQRAKDDNFVMFPR
jgi:hypothetical protein